MQRGAWEELFRTGAQRRGGRWRPGGAVVVLTAGILVLAGWRWAGNRTAISDPQPLHPLHEADLADRIDPNTADAPTLSVLPLIGEKRAQDIIAYREKYVKTHPGRLAFRRPIDLLGIRGIGATMRALLEPEGMVPETQSATQPVLRTGD